MGATKDGKTFREQAKWILKKVDRVPEKPFCDARQLDTVAINRGNLITVNVIGKTNGV